MAMSEKYEPSVIESKWQKVWNERGTFRLARAGNKPKKYVLEMLPYPSGAMHMGHVRNYLLGDVYARYFRMKGFDVVHPMGWDAFGLPAENAAIKDGVHPAKRTAENIVSFKKEMNSLGYSYDWDLEVDTSKPEYYRWNQWFFLKMQEMGLVYRRFSKVNWCTDCLTVIANEQVKDGTCERCGNKVIDREQPEWAFRITKYSQALLDGLDSLTQWPDRITAAQRNWIGKSEGVEADFAIDGSAEKIRVFTTRVDTIYGCTYVVIAPDHRAVRSITTADQKAEVDAFVAKLAAKSKTERTEEGAEKEGVFTGAYAVNPFTGAKVPVWIANFVLSDYGTGAVMSVPAHDARDFDFARKYALPIRVVIKPSKPVQRDEAAKAPEAFTEDGILVDSGEFTDKTSAEARKAMAQWLVEHKKGNPQTTWRQKDWGFSRQRYWGTPIPIVYCEKCDPQRKGIAVPYEQLPVVLPHIEVEKVLTGKGEPPLAKVPEWFNTTCPNCSGPATREPETMDTFVDSCWYYARYLSPKLTSAPVDAAVASKYLPVDIYVGGPEHATMHLLYFRFWTRVMKEMNLVPVDEPVTRLITQGIVNGSDGLKMSKRAGNGVAPSDLAKEYGADTARAYVLFAGPPERDFDWNEKSVDGAFRFLKRVWALAVQHEPAVKGAKHEGAFEGRALEIRKSAHKALKRITESIERLSFNTSIAGMMEFVNELYSFKEVTTPAEKAAMNEAITLLATMMVPFVPHFANELAQAYGSSSPLEDQVWPAFDPNLVVDDVVTYGVQVMGKLRGEIQAPINANEAEVRAIAEADAKISAALAGKTVKRFVFVPKKIANFVVG